MKALPLVDIVIIIFYLLGMAGIGVLFLREESVLTLPKNYQLNAGLECLVYKSQSTGFEQNIPLINLSFSRFLLKNKSGELKFPTNNLLDKALGANQTSSINYLERTTTNSIRAI